MSAPLYNAAILKLAASTATIGRIALPDATVEKRSPLCGSRVTVDIAVGDDGRVTEVGAQVRACALGQASTALMAAAICGRSADQIATAADNLAAYLTGTSDDPGDWPGLEIFAPARPHTARHASIRLAFEAAAQAAQAAQAAHLSQTLAQT